MNRTFKKITQLQKRIAERHLGEATKPASEQRWDVMPPTWEETKQGLYNGKRYRLIHDEIVTRHVSITSQLMASNDIFGIVSKAYRSNYLKGFKVFLLKLGIVE